MKPVNMQPKFKTLRNQAGFTLLELLVVVAILAIVAGGVMAAYDGLEERSARGGASHSMASVNSAIRSALVVNGGAPNDPDSLIAVTPNTTPVVTSHQDPGITVDTGVLAANLSSDLEDQLTTSVAILTAVPGSLPDWEISLAAAGITKLRYLDLAGNSNTCPLPCALITLAQNGSLATVGNIKDADIPNRVFDFPREGLDKNRGRGFSQTLPIDAPVAIFNPGPGGINLTKVGANPGNMLGTSASTYTATNTADVLVAVGLGNNASTYSAGESVGLAQAPTTYESVIDNEYSRFILLYNVGSVSEPRVPATLQAVIDAKGHFLDEELAEFGAQ